MIRSRPLPFADLLATVLTSVLATSTLGCDSSEPLLDDEAGKGCTEPCCDDPCCGIEGSNQACTQVAPDSDQNTIEPGANGNPGLFLPAGSDGTSSSGGADTTAGDSTSGGELGLVQIGGGSNAMGFVDDVTAGDSTTINIRSSNNWFVGSSSVVKWGWCAQTGSGAIVSECHDGTYTGGTSLALPNPDPEGGDPDAFAYRVVLWHRDGSGTTITDDPKIVLKTTGAKTVGAAPSSLSCPDIGDSCR